MPASTPLGIVYPCSGENIDCTTFGDYADSVQAAITNTQSGVNDALHPPSVWVRRTVGTGGTVVAPGVTTTITYAEVMYDTAGMFTLASPSIITITRFGTYLVSCGTQRTNPTPATLTSSRAAILVNGQERAYQKSDAGTSSFAANDPQYLTALLPGLFIGDQITTTCLFTGTGNMGMAHTVSVLRVSII